MIASVVGSSTTCQTMTHAQKYRERITRKQREAHTSGLMNDSTTTSHQSVATTAALRNSNEIITEQELDHFDESLLSLFQAFGESLTGALSDFEDNIDDEFVEECQNQLVSCELQEGR